MKKFKWVNIFNTEGQQKSLIEFVSKNTIIFHGMVFSDEFSIKIAARDKNRELKTVEENIPSVEEGMIAVEKFLFDSGVLVEGDEIEYEPQESKEQ